MSLEHFIYEYQTAHANKMAETENSLIFQKAINAVYNKHRIMAKLLFAENTLACSALKLNVAKNKD